MVGISQNEPGQVPAEPPASLMSAPAQNESPAGDDADPGALVVAELPPRRVEVLAQVGVDRVARVGPVVGDRGDVTVELVENGARHALILGSPSQAPALRRRSAKPPSPRPTRC